MNGPTEQDLRTALRELADEARPTTNLAGADGCGTDGDSP